MINQSLTLPNGQVIKNRIGKSALSETLATNDNKITSLLPNLYAAWAKGGAGLVVTGNVMIDKQHLGEPGNVVLEDESDLKMLTAWAKAGKQNGTTLWMQLNHPGKQSPVNLNKTPVAPSAIGFENKSMKAFFAKP
ncbi:MAG: NADH oxidase, partial [Pseudomonadota bacterium]|nr:NADH oxidase [Pseudomonadota bacterium]